jgi:hypothetical protein
MIKAIAIKSTKDGKTEILHAGLKGDCLRIAREEGLKIKGLGDACVQVFSKSVFNDDGRKAIYQANLEKDQKRAEEEARKRAADAKAKRIADLESELAQARGESKPAAKKAAKKAAKVSQ